MPGLWKAWKAKGRLPTLSTSPLEISPRAGEIPTFPQLRRLLAIFSGRTTKKESGSVGGGKVEIQNQDSHFSTAPTACGSKEDKAFPQEENRAVFDGHPRRRSAPPPGQRLIVVDREK